jgi:glycosyltransferase involved in cell wall biosynthesis
LADSPNDLAQAVLQLLEHPDRRARLGQSASRLVRANYSTEIVARQFEEICQQAVQDVLSAAAQKSLTASGRPS